MTTCSGKTLVENSIHNRPGKWEGVVTKASLDVVTTCGEVITYHPTINNLLLTSLSTSKDIIRQNSHEKQQPFAILHQLNAVKVDNENVRKFHIELLNSTKMSSETYLRRARGFANKQVHIGGHDKGTMQYFEDSLKTSQPITINTLHLQNSYRAPKSFEGFDNSPNPLLQLRSSIAQKRFENTEKTSIPMRNDGKGRSKDHDSNIYASRENNIQTCWKRVKLGSLVEQYCANSTLHGLRYLGDTRLSLIEKLFWISAFICAFLSATYFILHVYNKWTDSPIIISMSPEPVSFQQFPFPSVTICNMNNAKKTEANRINKGYGDVEKLLLEDICNFQNTSFVDIDGLANWNNVLRFIINVSQPCTDMLYRCQWHGNTSDCEEIFNPTMTDEGMCCNFNTVHRKYLFYNPLEWSDLNITYPFATIDWKPESGYDENVHPDAQPWRPYGAGQYYGLTVVLDTQIEEYYCSSTASVGFKMLLHSPVETPKIADFGFAVSPGKETHIIITPRISTSSPSIVSVNRKKRKCFFTSERRLKYYRTYTQRNCLLECEANFTQKICDCVQYYMPKSANTPICGKKDDECATSARRVMETKLYEDEEAVNKLNITETPICNCWPACFEINYEFTMSQSVLSTAFQVDEFYVKKDQKYFAENMAVVHLYFVESQFPKYVKSELFGFIDFLSNIGGLLGLFMGFSFLSVVEIFYFMTLRTLCRTSFWNMSSSQNHNSLIRVQTTNNSKILYPFSQ